MGKYYSISGESQQYLAKNLTAVNQKETTEMFIK